ncbi:acetyl-CoA hydrolase/transferase family protein [Adlercreutzia sp. ZJ138]|uniref:acetyl-CoA hydrolase/transferase family protein n=1 Tax=Adlercreutzia sp. ZJ138 TaxID=2709405 RepID=UPI0013EB3501|nr:acetyl-CoA hydrolase/transferase C-terminal domain-containing protein [Adlercreutzia sp. ZJ138]
MEWKKDYESKLITAEAAAGLIKDGDVFWFGPMATAPMDIGKAIEGRMEELHDVTCVSGFFLAPFKWATAAGKGHIGYECAFLGPIERMLIKQGNIHLNSFNFQHIDKLMTDVYKPNMVFTEVSAPDEDGYMSVGPFGAYATRACMEICDVKVVQVNRETPFVRGIDETRIHVSQVDYIVEGDHPLPEVPLAQPDENEIKIAEYVASEVPDGATIQIGFGALANAILEAFADKKDLGIHTEMICEAVIDLVESGVVNGSKKEIAPGKIVSPLYVGGKRMYEWCQTCPDVEQRYQGWVNDPRIASQLDNLMAINFGIMSDLTGQTASEGVGYDAVSGTGGQLDFAIAAYMSKNGKFFACLHSTFTDQDGVVHSNIVASLPQGTAVTTPRSLADYVVTEWGIVKLKDRSIPERVEAMISIAHPDFRDQLRKEAQEAGLLL